jgi:ketosteroid isomerase-like protein
LQGGRKVRRRGYTLSVLNKTPAGNWVLVRDTNLLSDA